MDIEEIREYCLAKKGVTEEFPFDETTLVFKVMGKMFVLTTLEANLYLNLKCEPAKAIELRESNPAVQPGYHMNKKHWNTVYIDGSMSRDLLRELIDHSYDLVVDGLSGKLKNQIKGL
jgi:predicted DNA-binding protein (MmcQ/YjbR family)